MPVGSGMSLAGVLWGLRNRGGLFQAMPVLGVVVGADPAKRLDKYAPPGWREMVELRPSGLDYHDAAPRNRLGPLVLDPIYEAKCLPFLRAGALVWIVGVRQTVGRWMRRSTANSAHGSQVSALVWGRFNPTICTAQNM